MKKYVTVNDLDDTGTPRTLYLTGQEWYDRFISELDLLEWQRIENPTKERIAAKLEEIIRGAAQRAAHLPNPIKESK